MSPLNCRRLVRRSSAIVLLALSASVAHAQSPGIGQGGTPPPTDVPPPGWTLTPSILYGAGWDDNVLVSNREDQTVRDVLQVVSPRAELVYNGRRSRIVGKYSGGLSFYRDLRTLNSYDQRVSLAGRHAVSRHLAVFAAGSAAMSPTTELVEFIVVPFVRTGSSIQEARGGVEAALSSSTTIVAAGTVERVHFNDNPEFSHLLRGGYGAGGTVMVQKRLSDRTALTADYDLKFASVGLARESFQVQNAAVGVEERVGDSFVVTGAAGVSRLGESVFGPARTGLHWRAGVTREYRRGAIDAAYARSFVPSYGFGGTTQNDDVTGRVRVDITRGFYSRAASAWRLNEPLTNSEVRIHSFWLDTAVGYTSRAGLQVEGFWAGTRQTVDSPSGGELGRNQIGIHVIATKSMRIR